MPAHLVGPYAEADAVNTLALFEDLNPILDQENTRDAYRLDVDLLPMVHGMRRRGIRVNQNAAEQARNHCLQKRDRALAELSAQLAAPTGMDEIASPIWKARTFDTHGIGYPRTAKGNPSFKAGKLGWMGTHHALAAAADSTANKYNAAGAKFLEGHILAHLVGDRIYAEINPHRSESGGTKSFRFSYSARHCSRCPPATRSWRRSSERLPAEQGETWCTVDCSQQEFASSCITPPSAIWPAQARRSNATATIPTPTSTCSPSEITGLPRKDAKAVDFAKIYGAGVKKFAEMIGRPLPKRRRSTPSTIDNSRSCRNRRACQNEASRLGYTLLYDGARRHWDRWARETTPKGRPVHARGGKAAHPRSRPPLVRGPPPSRRHPHRLERADSGLGREAHKTMDARAGQGKRRAMAVCPACPSARSLGVEL